MQAEILNYAIKLENSLLSNKLKLEKEIYEVMYGIEGFPTCHGIGSNKTSNYFVMDSLGPSLNELFINTSSRSPQQKRFHHRRCKAKQLSDRNISNELNIPR